MGWGGNTGFLMSDVQLPTEKMKTGPYFVSYRKNSKNWDTIMITVIVVKVERYGFTLPESTQKGGDGIANTVDPDQTAPSGAVCSGSALFAQTYLSQYLELLRYADINNFSTGKFL